MVYLIEGQLLPSERAKELLQEAAFMPSDRHSEGLAAGLTVRENASFAALGKFTTKGIMRQRKELSGVGETFNALAVKTAGFEAPILSLSGGNQQKVVIGKVLLAKPKVIILDEPTRGVDIGAKFEIYKLINSLKAKGMAIILISSEMPEILGLRDRKSVV